MVLVTTDNRNRTSAEIRHTFSRYGGNLGSSGCVSYLFDRKGYLEVPAEGIPEEDIFEKAVEAGAEDIQTGKEIHQIFTSPEDLYEVKEKLEKLGVPVEKAQITWVPVSTVSVDDPETARRVIKLIDALDDLEDVQQVISNFEIPEEILQRVEA